MDLVDQLEDILDSILPEEENSIIESEDFYSVVYELVNEYMKSSVLALMNEDHHETLLNEIFQLVVVQFEFSIKFYDYEKCREKIEEIVAFKLSDEDLNNHDSRISEIESKHSIKAVWSKK